MWVASVHGLLKWPSIHLFADCLFYDSSGNLHEIHLLA
jgi:hypothetical protein